MVPSRWLLALVVVALTTACGTRAQEPPPPIAGALAPPSQEPPVPSDASLLDSVQPVADSVPVSSLRKDMKAIRFRVELALENLREVDRLGGFSRFRIEWVVPQLQDY